MIQVRQSKVCEPVWRDNPQASHLLTGILKLAESKNDYVWFGRQILYKPMTIFCIPFIVPYLLSLEKFVIYICMYSILNKTMFTLKYLFLSAVYSIQVFFAGLKTFTLILRRVLSVLISTEAYM